MAKHFYRHVNSGAVREIEDSVARFSPLWIRTNQKPRCDDYALDTKSASPLEVEEKPPQDQKRMVQMVELREPFIPEIKTKKAKQKEGSQNA
jgi:hypothetical protein